MQAYRGTGARPPEYVRRVNGFTLIELIAVLVVLAIIGVAAFPSALDMRGSARDSSLNTIAAAVRTHATNANFAYLMAGQDSSLATQWWCGWPGHPACTWEYGYPSTNSVYAGTGLVAPPSGSIGWISADSGFGPKIVTANSPWGEQCAVSYRSPTAPGGSFTVNVYTSGC